MPGETEEFLDGHSSVALDERDDDVLAAQPGQKLVARGGPELVATDLVGEDRAVLIPARTARTSSTAKPHGRSGSRRSAPGRRAALRTPSSEPQAAPRAVTARSDHLR